jgi:hypothetical protein
MRAAEDVRFLVDRGYPKETAVRFVSDHRRLPEEDRFVLMRVIVPAEQARLRGEKILQLRDLREAAVAVDGYNVLIATESILARKPIYLCDDGLLRDTQGIFRSYRSSELTGPALSTVFRLLATAAPACTDVLLDQQISMSGRLAQVIRRTMAECGLPGMVETAKDVDFQLKTSQKIVATSDGHVVDAALAVVDIPAEIARRLGLVPISL